jgi:hypothetical protein
MLQSSKINDGIQPLLHDGTYHDFLLICATDVASEILQDPTVVAQIARVEL